MKTVTGPGIPLNSVKDMFGAIRLHYLQYEKAGNICGNR